jgi:FKBP-type peptidyl-prolyl cis-trans isomerase
LNADDSTQVDSLKIKIASLLKGLDEGMKGGEDVNPELTSLGTNIGTALKEQQKSGLLGDSTLVVDMKIIKQGLINGIKGFDSQMTADEAQTYLNTTMQNRQNAKLEAEYGANKATGELFLQENKKKEGVQTTESGLQYEVITMGKGPKPTPEQTVNVHYHGTLLDGTVFDSSVDRGESTHFGVTQVIPGWTEALQLMPVGSKFKLYIPQELAYGSQGQGGISPFSTLIFEVELIGIDK